MRRQMKQNAIQDIASNISSLTSSGTVQDLVRRALSQGVPVLDIIQKGLRPGLEAVGQKYEAGEYFLSELLFSASIMNDVLEILKPQMEEIDEKRAALILGTVRGDMHDIGKNIFKMLALATGFDVIDLGVDVEPEKFMREAMKRRAQIVGMSALLTTALPEVKTVVDRLDEAGVRDNLKIIIGGNAVTKDFGKEIGADATALDAVEGIRACKGWI